MNLFLKLGIFFAINLIVILWLLKALEVPIEELRYPVQIDSVSLKDYEQGEVDFRLLQKTKIDDEGVQFPEALEALRGQPVEIIGFASPLYGSGAKRFLLSQDPFVQQSSCAQTRSVGQVLIKLHDSVFKAPQTSVVLVHVAGRLTLYPENISGSPQEPLFVIDQAAYTFFEAN